jgi:hypothetical protein
MYCVLPLTFIQWFTQVETGVPLGQIKPERQPFSGRSPYENRCQELMCVAAPREFMVGDAPGVVLRSEAKMEPSQS